MINLFLLTYTCFCLLIIQDKAIAKCTTAYAGDGSCVPINRCYRLNEAYKKIMGSPPRRYLVEEFLLNLSRQSCDNDLVCCSDDDIIRNELTETTTEETNFNVDDLLPSTGICGLDTITNKVLGGTVMSLDEFAWIALIQYHNVETNRLSFECGGTLISTRYVLTAAHCLTNNVIRNVGNPVAVRLGEYNLTSNYDCKVNDTSDCTENQVEDIKIETFLPHPLYSRPPYANQHDIGIIRLAKDVEFTFYIKPICLPPASEPTLPPFTNLTVAGFGKTQYSEKLSDVKQKLELQVFDHKRCVRQYSKNLTISISEDQICAGGEAMRDSCTGDSGSSLAQMMYGKWYLMGIVSFGLKCGEANWPGIYTYIPHYIEWIKSNIKP